MFDPVSPLGKAISDVFVAILALGAVVFVIVTGLVVFAIIRYRAKGDMTEPEQVTGNPPLELTWTIVPALILLGIFIPTVIVMGTSDPNKENTGNPDVQIIGHQFWWEYRYTTQQGEVITANEMYMPTGTRLLARLVSADVQHDFWVPRLGRKVDVYPDKPNYLYLQSDQTAILPGNCAQLCGAGHAWMLIRVKAEPAPQFNSWLQTRSQVLPQAIPQPGTTYPASQIPEREIQGADIANGYKVFGSNTCVNCHAIKGTNWNAQVAPNLSNLGERDIIGAGVITNTADNLKAWIRNPQAIKPGVLMPAYGNLTDKELNDLVAYLEAQR